MLQGQAFHSPEAGEQEEADCREAGRVLAIRLGRTHRRAEHAELRNAGEAPVARYAGEAAISLSGIALDLLQTNGVFEDRVKRGDGRGAADAVAGRWPRPPRLPARGFDVLPAAISAWAPSMSLSVSAPT